MFRYVGGKKRGRNTVQQAAEAVAKDNTGEKAIYDEGTGQVYTIDGKPALIISMETTAKVIDLLSVVLLKEVSKVSFSEEVLLKTLQDIGEPYLSATVQLTQKRLQSN